MNTAQLSSITPARGMGIQSFLILAHRLRWLRALELDYLDETLDHERLPRYLKEKCYSIGTVLIIEMESLR